MLNHNRKLLSIEAPHFSAGLLLEDGIAVRAAPIVRWMLDKLRTEARIRAYCLRKGFQVDSFEV